MIPIEYKCLRYHNRDDSLYAIIGRDTYEWTTYNVNNSYEYVAWEPCDRYYELEEVNKLEVLIKFGPEPIDLMEAFVRTHYRRKKA